MTRSHVKGRSQRNTGKVHSNNLKIKMFFFFIYYRITQNIDNLTETIKIGWVRFFLSRCIFEK